MRILVTGGGGFIGTAVADRLVAAGHQVRAVDALLPQAHGSGGAPVDPPYEWTTGDVRDFDLMRELLADIDVVCHQAAMVGHGLTPADAPEYASHNDYATAVLLSAMAATGVSRLVLASSMVVYGEGAYSCAAPSCRERGLTRPGARHPVEIAAGRFEPPCPRCGRELTPELVTEDAPLDPRSTYAATKLAQEHLAGAWARQTGGTVWALRYHNVYGPGMPRDTPYAGVASIFRSALENGQAPQVLEDGRQRRDFVHVRDVAAANMLAIEKPLPTGAIEAVNICSGAVHTVGELAETLAVAMGGPAPEIVGGARAADVRHVTAASTKASQLLGFNAKIGFEEGISAFATDPLREPAAAWSHSGQS